MKNAKQKAKSIIGKFNNSYDKDKKEYTIYQNPEESKRCALICVDEILQEIEDIDDGQTVIPYDYWRQVKKEIEQL